MLTLYCFLSFLRSSWLNCALSGMVLKISSSCTSKMSKFSLSVKTGNVLSDRRDVDPHRGLQAVQGRMGQRIPL